MPAGKPKARDAGTPESKTSILIMAFTAYSSEVFAKQIEHAVTVQNMSYMDAVLHYCETRHLEPDMVVPFLTTKIKTGIQRDAAKLHLIRERRELPFDD